MKRKYVLLLIFLFMFCALSLGFIIKNREFFNNKNEGNIAENGPTIAVNIDGKMSDSFPTTSGYTATYSCVSGGNGAMGSFNVQWNSTIEKWVLSGSGVTQADVTCLVDFKKIAQKGDIIVLNLGNATPARGINNLYRVLSVNDSIVQVVSMFDASVTQKFDADNSNVYNGSDLDIYLNTTWYNSLSSSAKTALVQSSITQYGYNLSDSALNNLTHASKSLYSSKTVKDSNLSRYVYALDIEDIEKYFGGSGSSVGTFSKADFWTLFWNTDSIPLSGSAPWLRSCVNDNSTKGWYTHSGDGFANVSNLTDDNSVRPAFQIDLSKINWSLYNGGSADGQSTTTIAITNINYLNDVADGTFTASITATSSTGNIKDYCFTTSSTSKNCTWSNVSNASLSANVQGSYSVNSSVTDATYYVYVRDANNSSTSVSFRPFLKYYTSGQEYSTVLSPGTYDLKAYGAQGGSCGEGGESKCGGGKGGYATGIYNVDDATTVYVNAGGQGLQGTKSSDQAGGYNGGGVGGGYYGGSGGGASHIATKSGLLKNLSDNKASILLVAGGGGGGGYDYNFGDWYSIGGGGGGTTGNDGTNDYDNNRYNGTGGSQTAAGYSKTDSSKCKGGFGYGGTYFDFGGGGGGGYYGGGGGQGYGGGGGGSGYLSSTLINGSMSNAQNSGAGYVIIKLTQPVLVSTTSITTFSSTINSIAYSDDTTDGTFSVGVKISSPNIIKQYCFTSSNSSSGCSWVDYNTSNILSTTVQGSYSVNPSVDDPTYHLFVKDTNNTEKYVNIKPFSKYYQSGEIYSSNLTSGTYEFHVYGAQGGHGKYSVKGASGEGGYSSAIYNVDISSTIYVVAGGKGVDQNNTGGYNGGGNGTGSDCGGGGGASHIALRSGLLSTLSSYTSDILIVAGGGGGGGYYLGSGVIGTSYYGYGGDGAGGNNAGLNGTTSHDSNTGGLGGTLSSPGYSNLYPEFGVAGFGYGGNASTLGGGGGGGYYGGGGAADCGAGGGGGSGYIKSTLTNATSTIGGTSGAGYVIVKKVK